MATSNSSLNTSRSSVSPRASSTWCLPGAGKVSSRPSICSPLVSRASIRVASPTPAQPPQSPRLVSDGRRISSACVELARGVHHAEKNTCDCYHLLDSVKSQLEIRLSSLEVLVRDKLSDLGDIRSKVDNLQLNANLQANTQDNLHDDNLQSKLQSIDALNSRVFNLEANQQLTARTLQHTQSLASNPKFNDETVTRCVAVINSQMAVLSSELHQNSKILGASQDRVSNMESEFLNYERALRWMECQVLDLSRRLNKMASAIEESQEKEHWTQHGMTKLANTSVTNKVVAVPSLGNRGPGIEVPRYMSSFSDMSKDSEDTLIHGDGIKDVSEETALTSSTEASQSETEGVFKSVVTGRHKNEDICTV